MKKFIKSLFAKKIQENNLPVISNEKIEEFSREVMEKYKKTFSDLARYDRKEVGLHELSQ